MVFVHQFGRCVVRKKETKVEAAYQSEMVRNANNCLFGDPKSKLRRGLGCGNIPFVYIVDLFIDFLIFC